MNASSPIRAHEPLSIAVAVLTLLAILIAPVCAPLCAAKNCVSGTRLAQCHEMASMGTDGGEEFVAPNKACAGADFSAVLAKADEEFSLSQDGRRYAVPMVINYSPESGLGSLRAKAARWGVHLVPLEYRDSLQSTIILRI